MLVYLFRLKLLLPMLCALLTLAGCTRDLPHFVPPDQRPLHSNEKPWPTNRFLVLAYHNVTDQDPDQRYLDVRTDHLEEQFSWLRESGYQPVSVSQILAAHDGGQPLPPKAVLLSFDDGYRSFYTRVFPMLKAYGWPALLAPVGAWVNTPADQPVDFGGQAVPRNLFLTRAQLRELARSPLVEIGSHTYDLHHGVPANPQGNAQPAAATYAYNAVTGSYESNDSYAVRLRTDSQRITGWLREVTGKSPRVWVWPYGAANGQALRVLKDSGYRMALTLGEQQLGHVDSLMNTPRLLVSEDPILSEFAHQVLNMETPEPMRVAHVDLDYVYDPDPAQTERNIGSLVQRIADLQINTVFLQAFADPDGDGLARSLYFPNRHLPMRADLFNRVSWQLTTRSAVKVFAWMPVLSFDLAPSLQRVQHWDPTTGSAGTDPRQYARLSPFDADARRQIIEIYEDLARSAPIGGLLYHDDALLSDYEDASPAALAAYRAAGLPDTIAALRADPETLHRWTRFKSRQLIDFTNDITAHVRAIRGPQVLTARNIYAQPVLNPQSEAWFAQNLDDFLANYDWTAPMAMPLMEGVPADKADAWLDHLVDAIASRPLALDKTVFEVQTRDWAGPSNTGGSSPIPSEQVARWMSRLQRAGAQNFGYYPDDFVQNQPRLDIIRPAISTAWYPFQ